MPSFDQVIVWMVVGLIGGSLAGLLITWEKQGLGWSRDPGPGVGWRACWWLSVSPAWLVSWAGQHLRLIARYRGGRRGLIYRAGSDLALAEVSGAVTALMLT